MTVRILSAIVTMALLRSPAGAQAETLRLDSLDRLKQSISSAKSPREKALVIQAAGYAPTKDATWVPAISPFLAPAPADIDLLLPVSAMASLARFKGQPAAAQALGRSLPLYQRTPCMLKKLLTSLAQVGHDSVLPVFEGYLRGPDGDLGVLALQTLAEMPPCMALDLLLREWDRAEQQKAKASPEAKQFHGRMAPEYFKAAKAISGQPYPTMAELVLWWKKFSSSFKEKIAEDERTQAVSETPAPPSLPPILLVEMLFEETGGGEFANTGVSSLKYGRALPTKPTPVRSVSTPWGKGRGTRSLDFGKKPGLSALDLEGAAEVLKGLVSFTITGWINNRVEGEGAGGSRIATWLGSDSSGVELVYRAGGGLQLGIGEPAAGSPAKTPSSLLPPIDEKLPDAVDRNWRFFAVTYDSTAPSGQVAFYIGSTTKDPWKVAACDYSRGPVGGKGSPILSIGNVTPAQRATIPDAMFRGLLDDVRIFGSRYDGSGALSVQDLIRIQDRPPTPKKP
jgi:hypothetical protein